MKQAFALSPRDPLGGPWHSNLGVAEICRGRLDAAIGEFKQAIDAGLAALNAPDHDVQKPTKPQTV